MRKDIINKMVQNRGIYSIEEYQRMALDVIPKNTSMNEIIVALIAGGGEWPSTPDDLPMLFTKHSKINMWSRYKPVVNTELFNEDFDFPKNVRSTPDGNEQYGLIFTKNQDWTDIHEIGWKYNFREKGKPLRLADFVGYAWKARVPVSVNVGNWFQNRKTYVKTHKVNSTERQLSLDDFDMFEGGQTYYFGFVVNNHVMTVPQTETMEFDFRDVVHKVNPKAKVTAILHPEEIKEWTNISSVNKLYKPISLPEFEGLDMEFEVFVFISDISMYVTNYDLHCGRFSIVEPHKNYEVETTLNGTPPQFMRDGFKYRVSYSGITDDRILTYDEEFIPSRDLTISGSKYTYRIKVGEILAGYDVDKHFVKDKEIEFSLKQLKDFDNEEFESDNYITAFKMIMKD